MALGENNADTADYELNVEATATEGVYTLEIVGKNNYRGVRKVEFKAVCVEFYGKLSTLVIEW